MADNSNKTPTPSPTPPSAGTQVTTSTPEPETVKVVKDIVEAAKAEAEGVEDLKPESFPRKMKLYHGKHSSVDAKIGVTIYHEPGDTVELSYSQFIAFKDKFTR